MSCLREVQTISKSPHILPMPSLTRLTTGGVLNPLKNTTKIGHNKLLHQEPLQPPLEPRVRMGPICTGRPHSCASLSSPQTIKATAKLSRARGLWCPWAVAGPGSQEREPAATHSPDQSSRRRLCSGHRMACPPARRPRRELRSARRLEARPGPAGPAAPSTRATLAQYVVMAPACLPTQPTHKRGRDRCPGHGLVDE